MKNEADYVDRSKTTRIYVSKQFEKGLSDRKRPARFISRIFESGERDGLAKVNDEVVLRVTKAGRQRVKVLFYVDDRSIDYILLQRFNASGEKPREQTRFTLRGHEIKKLVELLKLIEVGRFGEPKKIRIEEGDLEAFVISDDAARALARANPELTINIAQYELTKRDISAVAYRKKVLDSFQTMLDNKASADLGKPGEPSRSGESAWQALFEANPWIFGYGLFYVFTSTLDDRRLEQIVAGTSIAGRGKRVDALLRTRGGISSLCFVEIKTPQTPLLEKREYRPETWAVSGELSGAIAQAHRTVQVAEKAIGTRLDSKDPKGNPTGEEAFLYRPRSVVVIGSLKEFQTEKGVNEPKFSSFELFRRQMFSPEVITFDELYERARFIVEASEDLVIRA